jgi:hypothetical protein
VFYDEKDKIIRIEFSRLDTGDQSPYAYKYIITYTENGNLFKIIEADRANKNVVEFG